MMRMVCTADDQLAVLIAFGALMACTGRSEARQGYVVLGIETSAFQPCGDAERWWLSGGADGMSELQNTFAGPGEMAGLRPYVEVRGVLSREVCYGHLGAYARTFHVTR